MKLHNFDAHVFLRDYWQRKPLLIRNPWDQWHNPIDPDELAGLRARRRIAADLAEA
jgi:50S ribosomal protein L16 3-hydroxylase